MKKYYYKMLVVKSHNYHNHVAQISKRFILASIKMFMSARTNSRHADTHTHTQRHAHNKVHLQKRCRQSAKHRSKQLTNLNVRQTNRQTYARIHKRK